jgi:hypothetical protein
MPEVGDPLLFNLPVRRDEAAENEDDILARVLEELEALSGRLDDCDRVIRSDQGGLLLGEPPMDMPQGSSAIINPPGADRCMVR